MSELYSFPELKDIITRLRSKTGCPWDLEQTHESLIPCMEEETKEAIQGIHILSETGDGDNLCEELGDVLLQVMLHSQIAEEEGLFTIEDVIDGLSRKMIRRHPHVFGTGQAETASDVIISWEEIKKQEKVEKSNKK